jgi:hypothetical protein
MIIETRFNVGDAPFWVVEKKMTKTSMCAFCSGSGKITGDDGTEAICPRRECKSGKIHHMIDPTMGIDTFIIGRIRASYRTDEGVSFDYVGGQSANHCTVAYDVDLFANLEEAQREVKKRLSLAGRPPIS